MIIKKQHIRYVFGRILGLLLDFNFTRFVVNFLYNRFNWWFVNQFYHTIRHIPLKRHFNWKAKFLDRKFIIPVTPSINASWGVALGQRWHEPATRLFFEEYVRFHSRPGIFFDIGSNYGIWTYPLLASGYECVLFEPQVQCNEYVQLVAELNTFHPRIQTMVLSDQEREHEFFVSPATWYSSLSRDFTEQFESAERIVVQGTTLDRFCEQHQIYPDLIKIDVEGHEWEVLQGGRRLLQQHKPTIELEIWMRSEHKATIFDAMTAIGYQVLVPGKPFRKVESRLDMLEISSENYILCTDKQFCQYLLSL